MVVIYESLLKIISKMEENNEEIKDVEDIDAIDDVKYDLIDMSTKVFGKIDPSIRVKMRKKGVSIIQNAYTGFDTEYKNIDFKRNELISVQLAVNTKTLLKLPLHTEYTLSSLETLTGKEHKLKVYTPAEESPDGE
jgi:hypothetical protein